MEQTSTMNQLPRRRREETRELLLEAGANLLRKLYERSDEHLLAEALAHIKFENQEMRRTLPESGDVLSEATIIAANRWNVEDPRTITTGAAYSAFESEDQYRMDLTERVLRADATADTTPQREEWDRLVLEHGGIPALYEAIRRLATAQWKHDREKPEVFSKFLFFPFAGHAGIQSALKENYRDTVEALVTYYTMLLQVYRLQVKDPFTVEHVATSLLALLEGFDLRFRVDSASVPDSLEVDGVSWSLFAYAAKTIVLGFLEDPTTFTDAPRPR